MEKNHVTLSIAIATHNEADNLSACLQSVVDWVDEIVVVDGGSTDQTVQIAKTFGAKVIVTDNPKIFHINKQKALDACHSTWILQLDADERVTKQSQVEILQTVNDNPPDNGFYIPRKNFFVGRWLSKGGQYPDYVIRLVRKGKAHFPCTSVHEQIVVAGTSAYLKNPLLHYSYRSVAEYWKKADAYTTLTADELFRQRGTLGSAFGYILLIPLSTFFLLYIRHKGFVDGWYGFLFSFFSALRYPIAYRKYLKRRSGV